ncbi:two-partner secretion domain-containing protein [Lyngbya aestuarii]|uniref:two-partner secretion domain-containing protein n=1 Tax=Lyngbya aestuarii TaxID=118322 RepID=UPI00403E3512
MKLSTLSIICSVALGFSSIACSSAQGQSITPELGSNSAGTLVTPNGNSLEITGGTLSGANLFHSFQQFGLNANQIANFLSNPNIENILGRVVGGNASVINGLIQVTGGNSHLFLINPAGIVFGNNARLDVPGSFTATTATGIGFGESLFNAVGSNDYATLVGNPSSFAFSTTNSGSIVNAGQLAVGQNLTLLGGSVISTGEISAPGGQITIAAVPGENRVRISQQGQVLSLELQAIESNVVNPLPFTPLALPGLLTTADVVDATGLAVNDDGTVSLTGSGVGINTETGTVIASGSLNTRDTPLGQTGGNVQILGAQIELVGVDVNVSGNLSLTTQNDIEIQEFSNLSAGGNLSLNAQDNINVTDSRLEAIGNIELLAQDTVTVENTSPYFATGELSSDPSQDKILLDTFVIQAEGNLSLQGNNAINLQTQDKWFQSGSDLSLVSDGTITANARFASGGDFLTLDTSANPKDFSFTSVNSGGIISSAGDVRFDSYEGQALKVEAGGSIFVGSINENGDFVPGDIVILEPNTSFVDGIDSNEPIVAKDPDIPLLTSSPALILRAGVTELENIPNVPDEPVGRTTFTSTEEASSPGNIEVGNIDTSAGGKSGPIILSATGNILVKDVDTTGFYDDTDTGPVSLFALGDAVLGNIDTQGSSVTLSTIGNMVVGNIDTNGFGNSSSVTLSAEQGSIEVSTIDTGAGGIDIKAGDFFRATGSKKEDFFDITTGHPNLVAFLEAQGISTDKEVALDASNLSVSIIARPGAATSGLFTAPITIEYGGASRTLIDTIFRGSGIPRRILVRGGSQGFVVGPAFQDNVPFVPNNSEDSLASFDPSDPFLFKINTNNPFDFPSDQFPSDYSGTVGGIAIGAGSNAGMYGSFLGRAFEPIKPTEVVVPQEKNVGGGGNGSGDGTNVGGGGNGSGGGTNVGGGGNGSGGGTNVGGGGNGSGGGTNEPTPDKPDEGNSEIATQPFQSQQRQAELTKRCQNDEDSDDDEECEEQQLIQQQNTEQRILRLDFQLPEGENTQPNNSTVPRQSIPELLTGGNAGNATEVNLNNNGQIELRGSGASAENSQ